MIPQKQDESGNGKVKIPVTISYGIAFLLLFFLCYEAHETFHHLVGGVLCGGLGKMTLTIYVPRPQCRLDALVTLAGPLLSYAIAWYGTYLLLQHKHMLFAYTLIFVSFAHLRFPLPLTRSGDEWSVMRASFSPPANYVLALILFLLALPPLIYAYRAIANPGRVPIFLASWLLPFLPLFSLPYFDEWLFQTNPDNVKLSLLGIPVIVLVADLTAIVLFVLSYNRIFGQRDLKR